MAALGNNQQHGVEMHKEEVLALLRHIASSDTEEGYNEALESLKKSAVWQNKQHEITGVVFQEMATRKKGIVCCQVFKTAFKFSLPPFSLIRDFGKQNTRGNVSKISVRLACY